MNRRGFKAEGWVECRCGKIRHVVVREQTQRLADSRLHIHKITLCRSCSATFNQGMDMCPEHIVTDGSVVACHLGFAHVGRCEPWGTNEEKT